MCAFQLGSNPDVYVVNEKEKSKFWDAFCEVGLWWRSLWWYWLKDSWMFFLFALPKADWFCQLQRDNCFIMVSIYLSVQSCIILQIHETFCRSDCEYSHLSLLILQNQKHWSSKQNVNMFCVLKTNTGTGKEKNGAHLFEVQNTKQA